jgi:hypothetical protein
VLCPNGRFVWTYRFFEATLCATIPIVQITCELYEGFRYLTMDDDVEQMIWNEADALHSAALCRERLTVHRGELKDEIRHLLRVNV